MTHKFLGIAVVTLAGVGLSFACSSDTGAGGPGVAGSGNTGNVAGSGNTGNFGGFGAGGSGAGPAIDAGQSDGSGGGISSCQTGPDEDQDQDGYSVNQGDCNDCDANANPGALDVNGNNVDEDCNGTPDDTMETCDTGFPDVGYADPLSAAKAIGLCHFPQAGDTTSWGVLEATYLKPDGALEPINDLSHGLLAGFGPQVNTQEGLALLSLSSGTARQPSDVGYQSPSGYDTGIMGTAPPGFPIDSPSCSINTSSDKTAFNPIAWQMKIRVPTNAKSFSFNFNFYTYEFPVYVCSQYNDFFVALQDPPPPNAQSGNISFDSQGNPVSVNNGFLEVCSPQTAGGKNFPCSLGPGQLTGTGFESHAATGWLETQSPVDPGSEVTLRFAIWDMGDEVLDSTVLIDNFKFSADEATGTTTKPVPNPR